jgi:hypothetical protein
MIEIRPLVLAGFVVVAQGAAACGPSTPEPEPQGCEAVLPADDPAKIEGTTQGAVNVDEGSCITGKAPETRYQVVPKQTGMLDLKLDSKVDLGMYVRSTCEDTKTELGCADSSVKGEAELLSVPVTSGKAVWVVVDGFDETTAGPFTLSVASRAIVCGDNRVEGQEECDPPDAGKTCTADCKRVPETCGDGIDNDVDQLIDCEDTDCAADAGCPIAAACTAATPGQATQNGDSSTGAGLFAGTCTGGSLTPEAVFSYVAPSTGVLLATLQSATNQGLYARATCADPVSEVACLDDNPAGAAEMLVVPVKGGASLTLFVDAADPADAGPFTLDLAHEPSTEVEPNDTTGKATPYQMAFVGAISPAGDVDYIAIDVPAQGATLTATIDDLGNGDCANFKIDSILEILGPDGKTSLAENDDAGDFCSLAEATELAAGMHFVRVSAAPKAPNPVFAYRLDLKVGS